jgi:RNA ligase (TIGR02306 family)
MIRKLATIQHIRNITPIEGADKIVQAQVRGWTVVVGKNDFQHMDKCVFFEIDSLLPKDAEWAQFMEPRKYRVKTCKMRGVLSQGLALPLSILTEEQQKDLHPFDINHDVTGLLRIKKWEPKTPGITSGRRKGSFPGHTPMTDEQRVQSELGLLDELKGHPYYITEKVDGSSGTFIMEDGNLRVCSRNNELAEEKSANKVIKNAFWQIAKKYNLEKKIPEGLAIQGEVYGPGIQKNRLKVNETHFAAFTIYNFRDGRRLDWDNTVQICSEIDIPTVNVVKTGESFDMSLEELLELAKGKYKGTKNHREGLVVRPLKRVYSRILRGPLSFKVINNDYLLKQEE